MSPKFKCGDRVWIKLIGTEGRISQTLFDAEEIIEYPVRYFSRGIQHFAWVHTDDLEMIGNNISE